MPEEQFCPHCGSPLRTEVRPYAMGGFYLGRFPFLVCSVEGRVFHPNETSRLIESAAKDRGIWGVERDVEEVRVTTVDNAAASPGFAETYLTDAPDAKAEAKEGERSALVTVLPARTKRRFVPVSNPATNEVA